MASHEEHHGHHLIPWKVYYIVFATLVVMTLLTYVTARYVDLGALNVPLALAIAFFKASLVVLFFMALKYDKPINAMVFVVGSLFVIVFLGITLLDTNFRGFFDPELETTLMDRDIQERSLAERDSVVNTMLTGGTTTVVGVPAGLEEEDQSVEEATEEEEGEETTPDTEEATAETDDTADQAALVAMGERLYQEKICFSCHTLDGSQVVGPTFAGLYGKQETMIDGTTVTVDDAYLRESIVDPAAKIVEGFQNLMPPQTYTDEEVDALIAFIKEQN